MCFILPNIPACPIVSIGRSLINQEKQGISKKFLKKSKKNRKDLDQ
jgi:hypothetical protein